MARGRRSPLLLYRDQAAQSDQLGFPELVSRSPYVASCYKEMALFIPAVRRSDADRWLADLDFRIWRAHPTVWLERIAFARC